MTRSYQYFNLKNRNGKANLSSSTLEILRFDIFSLGQFGQIWLLLIIKNHVF